MDNTIKEI